MIQRLVTAIIVLVILYILLLIANIAITNVIELLALVVAALWIFFGDSARLHP